MRLKNLLLLAAFAVGAPAAARADVKLHPLFSDHMVLQRDVPTKVWGTASPGEMVSVELAQGKTVNRLGEPVAAGTDGKWSVALPAMKAGTGYRLFVQGANKVTLTDVAFGDVWLCSGQSNMEWKVKQLTKDGQAKKVADGAKNENVRLFTVPNRPAPKPQSLFAVTGTEGLWLECNPETATEFSAVGYFFGRDIAASQKVTVGLISSDWGGTPAEAWTSRDGLLAAESLKYYVDNLDKLVALNKDKALVEAKYKADVAKWKEASDKAKADGKTPPRAPTKPAEGGVTQNSPTALYNGMIAPLHDFPIKGAIWYQGESNATRAKEYRTLMPALINDWRKKWGTDFPFFMVQLAPFGNGKENAGGPQYAELRDAQLATTRSLKSVGIAVITDVGDESDIHPQQKQPVGARLALSARAIAYGEKVEYSGPQYKSHTVDGDKVTVQFTHADGLMVPAVKFTGSSADGSTLTGDVKILSGFALCGEDKVFHPAAAMIQGDSVVLKSDKVSKPVAVRFGWVNFAKPALNLFNKAGLPAVPFRTDDSPLTTK